MIKNNQNLLSIIVPIFNVQDYVSKCVESIIIQKYMNLEIILIDDGSTDDSGIIIESYAKEDPRIKIVHQENMGLSAARNKGLDLANGQLIGFVDGDDWIEIDMYEKLYNDLVSNGADISICGIAGINDSVTNDHIDEQEKTVFSNQPALLTNTLEIIQYCIFTKDVPAWNKLYKRHLFEGIKYPVDKIYEDCFTTYRVMEKAQKVVVSPEIKYNHVYRKNSLSHSAISIKNFNMVEAFIEQHEYLSEKYPELEKETRKNMFLILLIFSKMLFESNNIFTYKKELESILNRIKKYSLIDCNLLPQDLELLKIIFTDLHQYVIALKLIKGKKKNGN